MVCANTGIVVPENFERIVLATKWHGDCAVTGSDACGYMSVVCGRAKEGGDSPEMTKPSDLAGRLCHAAIDAVWDGTTSGLNTDSSCEAVECIDVKAIVLGGTSKSDDSCDTKTSVDPGADLVTSGKLSHVCVPMSEEVSEAVCRLTWSLIGVVFVICYCWSGGWWFSSILLCCPLLSRGVCFLRRVLRIGSNFFCLVLYMSG